MPDIRRMRFPLDVILVCIRWYAAYPLSYRHLEEMMEERGIEVDHSSINRWAIRFLPLLEKVFRKHKRPAGRSWRMDETYIKVKGVWKYLYRAVDKQGQTVDFLLSAKRDKEAARQFFDKAMQHNDDPEPSPWIKASPTKLRWMTSMLIGTSLSRFDRSSISITLLSKIIVQSNVSPDQCLDLKLSNLPKASSRALNSCT